MINLCVILTFLTAARVLKSLSDRSVTSYTYYEACRDLFLALGIGSFVGFAAYAIIKNLP